MAHIDTVPIHMGEVFYLHSLLLHCMASSFTDLCTIEGHTFSSFHEASSDIGLFNNQNKGFLTMEEAIQSLCTLAQLHFLFTQIILEGYPAVPLWESF